LIKPTEEVVNDFRNHVFFCMKHLGLGEPTPMQYEISRQLQYGPNDFILAAGRGTGKSTLTAMFASWFMMANPNKTVLVLSATQQKAIEFVSQTRKILNMVPYCNHMIPDEHTKDSALGFNHNIRTSFTQDLSCTARGSTSQITGLHADLIICDDVEISTNTQTVEARERLLHKLTELESVRNKGSRVLFLGTPHSAESIYTVLKQSYPMVKYPALMPDQSLPGESEDVADWIWDLSLAAGESTQPERFDTEMLMERKAKIGPKAFALQYMLDTTLSDIDKYPLKLSDLIVFDVPFDKAPEKVIWQGQNANKKMPSWGLGGDMIMEPMHISSNYVEYQHRHMVIDPSGRGADETAVCIASTAGGMIYIHELVGWEGGYNDAVLNKIVKLCLEYGIKMVRVESNFGDGLFSKVITPFLIENCGRIGIEEFRVSGRKEARMLDTLEPVMAQHRLVWDRRVAKDEKNQIQLTRLTDERGCLKHDDRIDALASAVDFYKDMMQYNTDRLIQDNKQKEWENMVASWASDFRASDWIPHSGAIRELTAKKQQKKSNQWGWR